MKLENGLRGVKRLFLDTPGVVYYVERNPAYTALVDVIFDLVDKELLPAVTSPVTLAECLVMPLRAGLASAVQDFTDLIVSGRGVTFVPIEERVGRRAAELRASYNMALMDALQIAAALSAGCDAFLTNDLRLKRVTDLAILVLDELEP